MTPPQSRPDTSSTTAGTSPNPTAAGHIRGSWLLVAGRVANVVLDFAIQILLVRYLSTSDYGAFAYALSVVSLTATLAVMGLDRSIGRYLPMYDEESASSKVVGAWILSSISVFVAGAAIALGVIVLGPFFGAGLVNDPTALGVLLILVIMTPLNALASITRQVLATFASPRVILFRSYLLSPILELVLVVGVVLTGSSVVILAIGWLVAIFISSAVSTIMVIRILGGRGLLRRGAVTSAQFPVRPLFGFGLPLFGSSLVMELRQSGAVILLQAFHGTTAVALFRAAVPVARQTQIIFETFQILFTPLAARLFARDDRPGLNDAYWQTALWIAVFSFPLFGMAFAFPHAVIGLFFGDRYAAMAPALAALATGFYLNASLGFNALLLRILGRVRFTVTIDVASTIGGFAVAFPLIQSLGATGAAIAVAGTLVAQNIAYQVGLYQERGLRAIDLRFGRVYLVLVAASIGLAAVGWSMRPSFIVAAAVTAVASLLVFLVSRRFLNIGSIFPELRRIPLMRSLVDA